MLFESEEILFSSCVNHCLTCTGTLSPQRGRPIANDSAVQSLFAVISEMHPQLMTHIQEKEEQRGEWLAGRQAGGLIS